jgi:hypothetical protein
MRRRGVKPAASVTAPRETGRFLGVTPRNIVKS